MEGQVSKYSFVCPTCNAKFTSPKSAKKKCMICKTFVYPSVSPPRATPPRFTEGQSPEKDVQRSPQKAPSHQMTSQSSQDESSHKRISELERAVSKLEVEKEKLISEKTSLEAQIESITKEKKSYEEMKKKDLDALAEEKKAFEIEKSRSKAEHLRIVKELQNARQLLKEREEAFEEEKRIFEESKKENLAPDPEPMPESKSARKRKKKKNKKQQLLEEVDNIDESEEVERETSPESDPLDEMKAKQKAEFDARNAAAEERRDERREEATREKDLGNALFNKAKYEEAIEKYTIAIGLAPSVAAYYNNRCIAYMKLEKYNEALGDARKATDLDSHFTKAYSCQIKCLLVLGEGELAQRLCDDMLRKNPSDHSIKKDLKDASEIQKLSEEIRTDMENAEFDSALKKVDHLLVKSVRCHRLKVVRAEILVQLKRNEEAEKALSSLNESEPDVIFLRALLAYHKGELKLARDLFKQVLTLAPDDAKASKIFKLCKKLDGVKNNADSLRESGKWQAAINKYNEAMTIDPENRSVNAHLYFGRGACFEKQKKMDRAIADLSQAIEYDENFTEAYVRRAECYMSQKEYENAMDDLELAAELDESPEIARRLQEATKKYEEVEKQAKKDYYSILGVSKTTSAADLKKAYMKLAKTHHPDRHSHMSPRKQSREERKFKLISEAYNTLSDPAKKREYDSGGQNGVRFNAGSPFFEEALFRHFFFSQFRRPHFFDYEKDVEDDDYYYTEDEDDY